MSVEIPSRSNALLYARPAGLRYGPWNKKALRRQHAGRPTDIDRNHIERNALAKAKSSIAAVGDGHKCSYLPFIETKPPRDERKSHVLIDAE